jgi:pimeloyl-ACP methyl ester carboxylesterase
MSRSVKTLGLLGTGVIGAARAGGFSVHAGVDIAANQREKLERLCRYVSRPPMASERLALTASDPVRYPERAAAWGAEAAGTVKKIYQPKANLRPQSSRIRDVKTCNRRSRRFLGSGFAAVGLLLCAGSLGSLGVAAPAEGATAKAAAPPLGVDLNAFDASKKSIALPDGETLAYIDRGERSGPAVVLIHGYTDSARDWVPMLPYLSKRYRLILVDIRGHGQSSKPECCYTRLDFAYDIKLLLDALGVHKADIVGHSLGSIIAQTFAEYWPERTAHVVLISSTGGSPPDLKKKPAFDFAAEIRKLKEPIDPGSPFMIAWWDSPTPVDADFIRRQRKDAAGIPLRVWLAVLDEALPANNVYGDLQNTLPRLKAPTLLIWGSKDPIMEEDMRESLRDALPKAKVKIFDGLGHNPFWEDPRGVAGTVNAFLDTPL